jgi:hypothetical protein
MGYIARPVAAVRALTAQLLIQRFMLDWRFGDRRDQLCVDQGHIQDFVEGEGTESANSHVPGRGWTFKFSEAGLQ